ncbi:unnamed protein product [Schistosoma margrebowiei]|uniref:Uncharacterized protein n=1 Tax=Schistosoma margrebowiei TaxID=48269 RepID=A0A183M882_9TREM|nr:unnamed protein product [Schistosoma margrebowiei]
MKISTSQGNHGIQWTVWMQLDDLNFADDLVLRPPTHEQIQTKAASVAAASAYTREKASSPNTTRRTPNQSHLTKKPWNR